MKRVLLLLAVLLVVAGLALLGMAIAEHKGYVLFAYQGFRYESSLWAFLGLLLAVWLLWRLLRLALRLLLTSGRLINPWSRLHRSRRVRLASEQGFVDLAEGRWVPALRYLRRAAESDPQPLMYYLSAARAAHKLGQHEDSDALLERALKRQPDAELAIALTHAKLQQARGQSDSARETLEIMRERYPQHRQVLRQLQRLYQQAGDWSALLGLLPELRKHKVLGGAELAELERQAWHGRLAAAGQNGEGDASAALAALTQAWEQLSSAQRQEPELLAVYAEQLRVLGAESEAEELLHQALKRNYDSRLVRLYGLLRGRNPGRQLQAAEGWLKQHPQDAGLLLTVGRLCLLNQLWGKAKEYFESSLVFQRDPETCAELARLLARLGEVERSNQLFQEGLGLLDRRLGGLPLPQPAVHD
ncbi:heme biosynthesis HemY N-terminal domain-containing protein [Pseudomonas benzenivorans]|uniref:Heme biosynthesis HemY N-terminal domain-containing protein n=1 Tax=Pseudomonas benzenivorans TaxID=556533 RepID=A0ABZ0PW08_9PSED|nr:heme biosynthesis HemY N-terminal domain-containing protein [Pseudomonas benzenivorans]WPC05369.1 heme biosynthesis HemY N-terminal domain-containing protein [Pseudomonas benzenivorans]